MLIFRLLVPGKTPSWNAILSLGHWQRAKLKKQIAESFMSSLRASVNDSSMRTICAASTIQTYADTLESYQEMSLAKRKLRLAKKKSEAKKRNIR